MTNFPIIVPEGLDPARRRLWEELTLGPRGFYTGGPKTRRLPDLYNAWMQFPQFGLLMLRLGDDIRALDKLPGNLREIIVLTTSAHLGARVEFDFHVPFARDAGLEDLAIAALAEGRDPEFSDPAELAVWRGNVELLTSATLRRESRVALVAALGHDGLMQMIATIMLYTVTAWTTNVARVQLAEDFSADPEKLKDFFAGRLDGA